MAKKERGLQRNGNKGHCLARAGGWPIMRLCPMSKKIPSSNDEGIFLLMLW